MAKKRIFKKFSEDCKGGRRKLIAQNPVTSKFAMKLIPGQEFHNCCKGMTKYDPDIEHIIYVFETAGQVLCMGRSCADDLIKLANQNNQNIQLPNVINLLAAGGVGGGEGNNPAAPADINKAINNQLRKAIMLLVILAWKGKGLNTRFANIIERISNPQNTSVVIDEEVCYFYDVLSKDQKKNINGTQRSITDVYNDVSQVVPNLGHMTFARLDSYYQSIVCN